MMIFEECSCFLLLFKNLPEDKLKSFKLMVLAEDILRQPTINCTAWLTVATFMHISNEKRQAEKGKIQDIELKQKRSTRTRNGP